MNCLSFKHIDIITDKKMAAASVSVSALAIAETYVYHKIANITNNGCDLYYREPIDTSMQKATVMNGKYNYFYKSSNVNGVRALGKFKCLGWRRSDCRYDDYDYEVFEFMENDHVASSDKDNIYCMGIAETDKNMVPLAGMFSQGFPVYYKIN